MAQPAGAAVNQHNHLVFFEPKRRGNLRLEDAFDVLHFEKMVSAAERPELRSPALLGAVGDAVGVAAAHRARLLAELSGGGLAQAAFVDPRPPAAGHIVRVRPRASNGTFGG